MRVNQVGGAPGDNVNPLAVGADFSASSLPPAAHSATRAFQNVSAMMCPSLLVRRRVFAACFLFVSGLLSAQPAAPRPIAPEDFDAWRSFFTPTLSRDGRWLAYSAMPQDGDGDVIVRELATGNERRLAVGMLLPPPVTQSDEAANPEAPPVAKNIRVVFTSDSRFLVTSTHPTKAEILQARKDKKKPEEGPKNGLLMFNLATSETVRVPLVKSFQVPARGGAWVAYLKEAKPDPAKPADEKKPETEEAKTEEDGDLAFDASQTKRGTTKSGSATTPAAPGAKTYGTDLVLRDLATGGERTFENALDSSFARDGKTLLYTVGAKTETDNGVYAVTPGDAAKPVALLAGKGKYTKLTWDREQAQAVFLSDRDDAASRTPKVKAYLWPRGTPAAVELARGETAGPAEGLVLSDKGTLGFSRDGKKLYLPAATPPKPPRRPDSLPADEEKVTADLWRWNDDFVQPMQKVRAAQERNRTYRGILDLATKRYTQLADATLATVTLSDDGTRALGGDDRAYRSMVDYDGRYTDYHLVDPATGARRAVLKKIRSEGGAPQWSPDGQWVAYFQGKHWHALNTADGTTRSLTGTFKTALWNETDDTPSPPSAYGSAGWTKDSQSIVVYDRFDVWQVFTDGRAAKNLTAGHGRATKTALRVQRIEPVEEDDEERGLDPAKPLVLRGESEETRASGFFRTTFDAKGAPQRTVWGDKSYRYVGRATEADVLLVTVARFDTFPDLHTTDATLTTLTKVSDGAAQQKAFLWGDAELVSFKSAKGTPLKAALFKPANFDPKKKYPLIVYIYERLSQTVNEFVVPRPSQNVNASLYTSNGYLVLMPDIVYQTGEPGPSALRCVLPAIDTLVKRGCVDEKAIGIQGHSWGGYQIAYMVTQTNRFRAAEAGAPVGNMTSAYSGIRWGSGLPRQFQYEQTQSRLGQPLAEAPQLYLDNSPVFHLKNVKTPLLMIANDNDDAVPHYQGIELFLGLRRLGKQAWLFNYNGEFHGLRRRADQKDFAKRTSQFFDHFLKGAPAPEWMEKGIPYIDRDEEKIRFNAKPAAAAGTN
ncbi:MAG: prolyl oligopeptidase family serine peptidase [Verrucomicrobia bacterium]|nr:prolyl oligopeptidase family serine peptidase [Verrucomicrobiota bacterium]